MPANNNEPTMLAATPVLADAHGRAALLLVESLIHALCQNATLGIVEAVDIIQTAIDVQFEQAEAADGNAASMWQSHMLLLNIAASLEIDGPQNTP